MDLNELTLRLVLAIRARPMQEAVQGIPLETLRRETGTGAVTLSDLIEAADRAELLGLAALGVAQVGSAQVPALRLTTDHVYMTDEQVRATLSS